MLDIATRDAYRFINGHDASPLLLKGLSVQLSDIEMLFGHVYYEEIVSWGSRSVRPSPHPASHSH